MDYTLRTITEKEIAGLVSHLKTIIREDFAFYRPETQRVLHEKYFNEKEFLKILKKKKTVLLGAYERDNLVGFCLMVDKDGGVGFVEWLAILKDHRGKGLGVSLLTEIEKRALENKFHYIFLYTETEKNIAFYKKRGFEYVGLQRNAWFGENEHLLQKILRNEPFPEAFE